jgi:hypothetical protein
VAPATQTTRVGAAAVDEVVVLEVALVGVGVLDSELAVVDDPGEPPHAATSAAAVTTTAERG